METIIVIDIPIKNADRIRKDVKNVADRFGFSQSFGEWTGPGKNLEAFLAALPFETLYSIYEVSQ